MHGTIWKLSAVASVIGIGLLAVVLQNRFFGSKAMSLEAASPDGAETAASDDTKPASTDNDDPNVPAPPAPGGHGEAGPDDKKVATLQPSSNQDGATEADSSLAEPPDEDAATFASPKTGNRGSREVVNTASAVDTPFDQGNVEDKTPAPPDPHNSPTNGRRASRAAPSSNALTAEDSEPQGRTHAIRKPAESEEVDFGDPVDRTEKRNGRNSGRPNPGALAEEPDADQPSHAANASEPEDKSFSFNPETQPPRPSGSRTGARSGGGPSTTKRSPYKSFTSEEDELSARKDSQIEHQNVPRGPTTVRGQSAGPAEDALGQADQQGGQHAEEMPDSAGTIVPPVAPARSRPNSLNEDDSANDRPTARRSKTQPRAIPQIDRPIENSEPMAPEEQGGPEGAPVAPPPAARNNRPRNAALSEEEDSRSQSPPAVPVARPRAAEGNDPADIVPTTPRAQRNFSQQENPADFGPGNPADSNGPNPNAGPVGAPVPRGRDINRQFGNQPNDDSDRPEAAASGSTATDVIAPRTPNIAPPMPGAARGRARVTIEKLAPPTAVLGQPLIYNIIIRNSGNASAKQVVVEDDVPVSVTVQGSIPQAEMTGQKLKWKIGKLDVGEEQKISVKVVPTAEGPVGSAATVNFVHDQRQVAAAPDNAADAPVSLDLQYPQQVTMGQPFEVKFRLTNRTNSPLANLNILHQLPSGLQHESGQPNLEFKVKLLGAGERLEVPLMLNGVQSGNAISRSVVITADETVLVSKVFNQDVRQSR